MQITDEKSFVDELSKYSSSGWNLYNLPRESGSLLQYIGTDVEGVMVPWMYIGKLSMCLRA